MEMGGKLWLILMWSSLLLTVSVLDGQNVRNEYFLLVLHAAKGMRTFV